MKKWMFLFLMLPLVALAQINRPAEGGAVEGTAVLSTGEVGATKFLREDGDGTSSWQTVSTSPGGSDGQIQYNGSGTLSGDPAFNWNDLSRKLIVGASTEANGNVSFVATDGDAGEIYITTDDYLTLAGFLRLVHSGDFYITGNYVQTGDIDLTGNLSVSDTTSTDVISANDSTEIKFTDDVNGYNAMFDTLWLQYLAGEIGQITVDTLYYDTTVHNTMTNMGIFVVDTVTGQAYIMHPDSVGGSSGGDTSYFDLSGSTITRKDGIDSISFDTTAFSIDGSRFYTDPSSSSAVFIGDEAGVIQATHGAGNIGIGRRALYNVESGGYYNVGIGYNVLDAVSYGDYNTAVGYSAGGQMTYGQDNVFIGRHAGQQLTSKSYTTAVGSYSGYYNTSYGVYLGHNAGRYETGDNSIIIDNLDRTNEAGQRTDALFYGVTNATAASQTLQLGGGGVTTFNGTLVEDAGTIADNDATPDVSGANIWTYAGSANSVTVTDLDNPEINAVYIIVGNSDTYTLTINDGGNFHIGGNVTLGADDVIALLVQADNDYIKLYHTDN